MSMNRGFYEEVGNYGMYVYNFHHVDFSVHGSSFFTETTFFKLN